jgi:Holliday junction resolvase
MARKRLKSPYRKGYLRELEVVRILRESGKYPVVFRSAASHSPFDIVAISKSKVLLLQVKTGKFNLARELEKLKAIQTPKSVEKQLWVLNKEWKIIDC